jgi:recombination protein RecR
LQIAEPLQAAIDELNKLPTIGKKTALRLALYLLKSDVKDFESLVKSLVELKSRLRECPVCFNLAVEDECDICRNQKRNRSVICVVEEISDVIAVEKTNAYSGLYHVLGGALSPLSGIGPDNLKVNELLLRLQEGQISEVILALNPDAEGEATSLFLAQRIKPMNIKVTRIARGLPIGGDLEFADEATIGRAVTGRVII